MQNEISMMGSYGLGMGILPTALLMAGNGGI
jgi:hypothetical protein